MFLLEKSAEVARMTKVALDEAQALERARCQNVVSTKEYQATSDRDLGKNLQYLISSLWRIANAILEVVDYRNEELSTLYKRNHELSVIRAAADYEAKKINLDREIETKVDDANHLHVITSLDKKITHEYEVQQSVFRFEDARNKRADERNTRITDKERHALLKKQNIQKRREELAFKIDAQTLEYKHLANERFRFIKRRRQMLEDELEELVEIEEKLKCSLQYKTTQATLESKRAFELLDLGKHLWCVSNQCCIHWKLTFRD